MATVRVRKPLGFTLLIALLISTGVIVIGNFLIPLLAPFPHRAISTTDLWSAIREHGFLFSCRPGMRISAINCWLATLQQWLSWPPFFYRLLLLLGSGIVAATVTAILVWWASSPKENVRTIRGPRPLFGAAGRTSLRRAIALSGSALPDSLWLAPHVQLTTATEAANILVVGDQGSGKSAVIRGWTEQILARGQRAIIHDAKGDVLATAPIEDILLVAPHDARGWTWNIGCDVTNSQGAREVAEKLVPSGSQVETMWSDGAKAILSGAIEALQHQRGTAWGWANLFAFVFRDPEQLRAALDEARSPTANLIALDAAGVPVRTTLSLMLTLWVAALTTIHPLAQSETTNGRRRFSVRDWLSDRSTLPRTIILQHNAEYPLLSTAISSLLVDIVSGRLLSPSAPKRDRPWLHLILDELPVLGRLQQFPKLLNVGREKGTVAIVATQDWEQILKLYQPHDATTLEARFRVKIVCSLGISETRERVVTRYAGRRTIETWVRTRRDKFEKVRHESEIDVIEPDFLTNELGVRKRRDLLFVRVAVFGLGNPVIVEIPFTEWPELRSAYHPAAWATSL